MTKNFIVNRNNTDRNSNCFICGCDFKRTTYNHTEDYQQNICENCKKLFAKEDSELILLALTTYGGYFGSKKERGVALKDIVNSFLISCKNRPSDTNIIEKNLKLLHTALLHGYTKQELIEILKGK